MIKHSEATANSQNQGPEKFSRYEFKFLLSQKKAKQIENEIKSFMILDENALRKKDKKYFVRSLYFDTPEYSNFYEKVDGIKIRKKFRIRSYSHDKKCDTLFFKFHLNIPNIFIYFYTYIFFDKN